MSDTKISQIMATEEGVVFIRLLAGRSKDSGAKKDEKTGPYAPFKDMKDAYRALFIYGLIQGERRSPKKGEKFSTIYANVNMLTDNYDFGALLSILGSPEDLDDIGKSINEYTNWSVQELKDDYNPNLFNLALDFDDPDQAEPIIIKRK